MGCFFAIGCRQMGQFLRHILDQPPSQLTRRNVSRHVMLTDHGVEFFPLLKCSENRERFSVGCYRSG